MNSILQKSLLPRWVWVKHERGGELPFPHVPATNLPDPATPLFQLVKNSCKEMMAGDTHFVCLGGKSQVTELDRSVCVCLCVMHSCGLRVLWLWGGICGVFLYVVWLCICCTCALSGGCIVCVCGVHECGVTWCMWCYVVYMSVSDRCMWGDYI